MTREEAIYELSNIFAFGFYNDRVDEAVNMAIKALEQEETLQNLTKPIKRTDKRTGTHACDCISRQAAIDVLEERLRANGYSNVALVSELNRSIGYLMRLPSAQPERKTERRNEE